MKLNNFCEMKRSGIHGWGVVATRDIPKGRKIIQYTGKIVSTAQGQKLCEKQKKEGAIYIFTLNDKQDIDGSDKGSGAQFINHSCNPNSEAVNYDDEEIWIEAIKNIKKGEEILYNYGFDDDGLECHCGHKNCRGYM